MDPLENTSIILILILCAKLQYSHVRKRKVIEKLRVVLVCFFVVCLSMVLNGCKDTGSAITPPTGLTAAAASSSQINLSWTASIGATSYNVYEATLFEGPYTEIGSTTNTSYAATGLTNGTTYFFGVSVVNSAGESGYSTNLVIATPRAPYTYPVGSDEPYGIAIDSSGNVWVTNQGSDNVTEFSSAGALIETYTVGSAPTGIAIDGSGNVWVVNQDSDSVTELSSAGAVLGTFIVSTSPSGIAIDGSGNIWLTSQDSDNVTELSSAGAVLGTFTVSTNPTGIAIDGSGNIWLTNQGSDSVTELSSAGVVLGTFTVSTDPTGIAIDGSDNIWVVSSTNNNATEFGSSGVLKGTYAVGSKPYGIAIDGSGNVWVANWGDNTVTEFVGIASQVETP